MLETRAFRQESFSSAGFELPDHTRNVPEMQTLLKTRAANTVRELQRLTRFDFQTNRATTRFTLMFKKRLDESPNESLTEQRDQALRKDNDESKRNLQ